MFKANCKDLQDTLDKVSSVIESSAMVDILDCVLLKLDGDDLEMTGSNGQVQVTTRCKVDEVKGKDESLEFAVKERKLNDILRNVDGKTISFKADKNKLSMTVGTGHFTLAIREGSQFPKMKMSSDNGLRVTLSQQHLLAVLKRLEAAISTQTHRVYLAGAFFDFTDKSLHLVGTDGHRLATDVLPASNSVDASFIVPRKAVKELRRLIDPDSKDDVELWATKDGDHYRNAEFRFPGDRLRLASQLISGQYPAYDKVIPDEKTNVSHLVFDRKGLLNCVRQVSSVHDRAGETIKIISKKDADSVEIVGEGTSTKDHAQVDLKISGGSGFDLKCQVNGAYMQDMLNAFEDFEEVRITFRDGVSSVLCLPEGADAPSFRYVVMPVR